jgi:MFS family permease
VPSFETREAGLVVGLVGGSHVVNHMYFMLLPPIVPLLEADLGLSVGQVGVAIGLLGLLVTGLQLPFGHLSDTKGRTPMLAVSLGFGGVGAVLTATAGSYAWLLGAQVLVGVGIAAHHPAHYPLVSQATSAATRGRAFSIHGFTGAVGYAAPPGIVAGAGLLGVGWRAAILAIAAVGLCYGLAAIWVLRTRVDPAITAGSDDTHADEPWSLARVGSLPGRAARGLRDLLSSRGIVLVTALWFATSMAAWGIKSQTLPLLVGGYGLAEGPGNAIVFAMLVIGAVLMLAGGWLVDRTSPALVLVAGYLAFVGVAVALGSGALPVVAALGVTLVLAATIDYSRPARAALADRLSSADSLGKNFGLVTIGISGGSAVAPPVLGVIADTWSIEASFYAMAGLGLVSLALLAVVVRTSGARVRPAVRPTD